MAETEKAVTAPGSRLRDAAAREARSLRRGLPLRARFLLWLAARLPDFTLASTRSLLYRQAGFNIADGAVILGSLHLVGEGNVIERLTVGPGAVLAPGVTLGLDAAITLGKNVSVGPGATLYTATHGIGFGSRRMSPSVTARPIQVEDGAWVGMQALILPGTTIGRGSVVSAGAVVNADVEANTLVAGNPAAMVQTLPFGNR